MTENPPASVSALQVLGSFAASLSQAGWDQESLATHLRSRLPQALWPVVDDLVLGLILAFPGPVAPDSARILAQMQQMPGAVRILDHARRSGTRPAPWLSPPQFRRVWQPDLALPVLHSPSDLAEWLAISPEQLIRFADLRGLSALEGDHFGQHYIPHLIPKRDQRLRLIEEPKPFLKHLQRRILAGILNRVPAHPAAFGFVPGRNCAMAAAKHAGEEVVIGFDLRDFFPSVAFRQVYAIFRSLGYPAAVARDLAGLTTALTRPGLLALPGLAARDRLTNRHLPQGAPTSPALANLAARGVDRRLAGLARRLGAVYSRYADDLTFSGDRHIAPLLRRVVPDILREEGFALNETKTRAMAAHQRQLVTGLVVNRKINTPRAEFDRLKAILHHLGKDEDPRRGDPAFMASLQGRIAWIAAINPARGARLAQALALLP